MSKWRLAALLSCLVAVFAGGMLSSPGARAQESDQPQERETRKTPAMREKTYKKLSEARELAESEQLDQAIQSLNELSRQRDLNSYELAQIYNYYGYIRYLKEDYKGAIADYEKVLAQENLPLAMETATLYTVAQLYFVQEDFAASINTLNRWFGIAENPGPDPYVMLGQALYQQGLALTEKNQVEAGKSKYREAITPVEKAISIAASQGKPAKEQWLLLLRAFYFELGNYQKVEQLLKQLLAINPKKSYWVQLSGIYGERGDVQNQLIAYEMAYIQNLLDTGPELLTMAQLYLQLEVPYKAAKVLQKGFDNGVIEANARNYRLLAQALMLAREDEKALVPLTRAAELSDDGELQVRLANIYANLQRWSESADAAREALRKGGLRRPDQANIVLGMALYNLERYDQAIAAFHVARNDERSRRVAGEWIAHIGNEQKRLAELDRALKN